MSHDGEYRRERRLRDSSRFMRSNVVHSGTVKVPYAKKWQKEADKLRKIVIDCDLTEEMKWGKPCLPTRKRTSQSSSR
jgi:uncharacterized protein YdeI (YjbR/CyaY-like superfamily)